MVRLLSERSRLIQKNGNVFQYIVYVLFFFILCIYYTMDKILVTGGTGLVGYALHSI